MGVIEVLHMNEGDGETSYASNSAPQKKVISMTKPVLDKAIIDLCSTKLPEKLCIADLGCASGPNALFAVSELIKTVDEKVCKKLGRQSPEYCIYLNDLPVNDFNAIFKTLPSFQEKMSRELGSSFGPCFVTGVPGSFYGRLFPTKTLHFVHSSSSLHWLSQVPTGLEGNDGNIYIAATSPPRVEQAYYEQFQKDFGIFLKCRAEELIDGGRMVLTFRGRTSEERYSREGCYIWELFSLALNDMVSKGLIEKEKLNSFNLPQYMPSLTEMKMEVEKQGCFTIDYLDASEVEWNVSDEKEAYRVNGEFNYTKCIRAALEPLLVIHFGEAPIDEIFRRLNDILADCFTKEKMGSTNVTISLTKTP